MTNFQTSARHFRDEPSASAAADFADIYGDDPTECGFAV